MIQRLLWCAVLGSCLALHPQGGVVRTIDPQLAATPVLRTDEDAHDVLVEPDAGLVQVMQQHRMMPVDTAGGKVHVELNPRRVSPRVAADARDVNAERAAVQHLLDVKATLLDERGRPWQDTSGPGAGGGPWRGPARVVCRQEDGECDHDAFEFQQVRKLAGLKHLWISLRDEPDEALRPKRFEDASGRYQDPLQQLSRSGSSDTLTFLNLTGSVVIGELHHLKSFRALTYLDLYGTSVSGDLQDLKELRGLAYLDLGKATDSGEVTEGKITGSLENLGHFSFLRYLNLRTTHIGGRLADLCDKTMCPAALFSISLSGTEVTGTLADLQNFQQLTELSLSDTAVSGTLSEIRDTALKKLKFLFLSGTQVRADLGDLKHFPQLQGVHLSELTVGDLQTLAPLPQLTHLAFPGAPVTGELAALAPLKLLELDLARTKVTGYLLQVPQTVQVLDLSFTRVAGNLMDLSLLPLRQLSLKQCDGISGTLDHLAKSKPSGLEIVLVAQTSIEGDLKDFTGSEHTLKELDLSETKVRGDIQALSKFTQLTSLILYKLEAVQGDIRSLKALAKLESLDLHESSRIGGEFQSLSPTTLREVDLRHTVVSGSIEPSFARHARLLRNLDVSWTRIRPVFLRHHPFEDELFPKLKVIRMSGLPIQDHAVEVLSVFRHNRFLGIVELAHCSLTGELTGQFLEQEEGAIVRDGEKGLSFETTLGGRGALPGMTHEDVMKIAEMRRKVLPLGHALVSLDLSHNRITSVVFAVPKPLKYLLLSHNEALTTVSSAFLVAHDIEVDIRHTAVHNRVFSTAPFQAELPLAPHTEGAAFQVENKHYECYQPYRGMAAKRLMVSPDTFDPVGLCKCEGGYEAAKSHPGERGELECKVCPANYMSELQDGNTVCVKCPLGSFSSKGSTVCRSLVRNFLKIAFVVGISTLIFFYGLYLLLRQYRRGAQIERDFQIALEIADRLKAPDGSAFSLAKFGEVFVPPRRVPDIARLEPALTHIVLAYNEGRPAPLGKFWKPIPADLVTMVVLVACEIHQEYVDQAMDHWPDQALQEVAESKLGVLYEKQYKSVHAIVKTKPGYNLVSVAAEKLARTKTSPPVGLDTPDPRCVEHLHASASRPWTEDAIWHVVLVESTYEAAMSTFTQFRRFVEEVVQVCNAPQAKLQDPTLAPDDEVYQLAEEPVEPVEAVIAEIKALPRSIEKLVVRPRGGASWDLLRAQVVCHSCVDVVKVLDVLRDHHLKGALAQVCEVTDRFKFPQAGWADVSVYVHFPGVSQLVCELQVVHNNLLIAREELGAHDQYADTRFARELLTMRRRKDRQQSVSNVRD